MNAPRLVALALVTSLVVSGCGSDGGDADAAGSTSTAAPIDQPQRIVSLSGSLTEMLFAIGAGEQVVAVDKYSDYPAGTPLTDLSGFKPNVEAISGYEPDLVVLASDRDGIVDALSAAGVPALLLPAAASLADVDEQIRTLGAATGHSAEAGVIADGIAARIAELAAAAPEREAAVSYYYELGDSYATITSATFLGELLSLAGLASIADMADAAAGDYPKLSAESILAADPDVVFLAWASGDTPDAATVAERPGWDQLSAVQNGRVVVLDTEVATRWGPRIVELLEAVIDATAGVG